MTNQEIRGLDPAIRASGWWTHPLLQDLASHIASQLAPNRNSILHGARTNYGRAKESVSCLLALWGLAKGFQEIETGRSISSS